MLPLPLHTHTLTHTHTRSPYTPTHSHSLAIHSHSLTLTHSPYTGWQHSIACCGVGGQCGGHQCASRHAWCGCGRSQQGKRAAVMRSHTYYILVAHARVSPLCMYCWQAGRSALLEAAAAGLLQPVKCLVLFGADPLVKDTVSGATFAASVYLLAHCAALVWSPRLATLSRSSHATMPAQKC